ncbi:hypothetical protein ABEB36_002858 [Hypothenemus hampei]|uniref:Uncharacterized protein n=1 Tax=Hypothenemus hampei TaxID=57062 RepID=A0ABD1F796_HYPHA
MKFFVVLSTLLATALALSPKPEPQIISQESNILPEGNYQYAYETDNGIAVQEEGNIQPKGPEEANKSVRGQFKYTSPEGTPIQLAYVADENGYQPVGSHLPVPPSIPQSIQRALEYIAAHPEPQELAQK